MRLLSAPELDAVLIHEATHARRHDNLIRLIHEAGLCALWFHPFVWLTGSRLALYRELSCDESVIRSAHGEDLVSALAKLATPQEPLLLRAGASSFLTYRLARLSGEQPRCLSRTDGALGTAVFAASLIGGVWGTVSHTACCFLLRK
jgi:beta-lactamase regulating signal transducer with metallopeptidase domain